MMREVKGYKLLEGYRGSEPADVETIAEIISKVSKLVVENEEIRQLDLNPIIVWREGAKIADAKIILRP
jgi:acetyl-CoA synthetase (ADP-forming)